MRTQKESRKHGHSAGSSHGPSNATHKIKIGCNKQRPEDKHKKPGRLNGFLICGNSLGDDGNLVVDYDCMLRLGAKFTKEQIEFAKQNDINAPAGTLPSELHFIITNDSVKVPGNGWDHTGTFSEGYGKWDNKGLFCEGDGQWASRKQSDGSKKQTKCVPHGKAGAAAETFCEYSIDGSCRHHCRAAFCIFVRDENGRPEPLSRSLGWGARFQLDSTSESNAIRIGEELDKAAERLHGRISGITGVLVFARQSKRRPGGGVGIVGQVMCNLSEPDIARREQQIHDRFIEQNQTKLLDCTDGADPFAPPTDGEDWQDESADTDAAEDAIVDTAHEILGEPEQEPAASDPNDSPAMATPEQLRIIDEWLDVINQDREEGKIDIGKVMEKKGLASTAEMTVVEAEKTITWLKCKVEEGQGSC